MKMLRKSARGFRAKEWLVEHALANYEKPEVMRALLKKGAAQGWTSVGGDPEISDGAEQAIW